MLLLLWSLLFSCHICQFMFEICVLRYSVQYVYLIATFICNTFAYQGNMFAPIVLRGN